MKLVRCWTGRRWIEIGPLGIGFGPLRPVERIVWRGHLVWANKKAWRMHARASHEP
jgi:hypothetical protein